MSANLAYATAVTEPQTLGGDKSVHLLHEKEKYDDKHSGSGDVEVRHALVGAFCAIVDRKLWIA